MALKKRKKWTLNSLGEAMEAGFEMLARLTQEQFALQDEKIDEKIDDLRTDLKDEMNTGFDALHDKIDTFESEVLDRHNKYDQKLEAHVIKLSDHEKRIAKIEKSK